MKTLTIEIAEPGEERCGFDVVDEQGRRCDGLSWDEMLGQVAMLTIPPARVGNGFAMHTPEEWAEKRAKWRQHAEARRASEGAGS